MGATPWVAEIPWLGVKCPLDEAGQERVGGGDGELLSAALLPRCLPYCIRDLGTGPNLQLPFPRVWLAVCPHCLQRPRGGGLNNIIALRIPTLLPRHGCSPEAGADPCPGPGGRWLEHCNNANPMPTPNATYQPIHSNPSESEVRVLGLGASITTTNCPCSCVPSLPGPGLGREQARVHSALEPAG